MRTDPLGLPGDDALLTPKERTAALLDAVAAFEAEGYRTVHRLDHHVTMSRAGRSGETLTLYVDEFGNLHRS
jgi:hypothetical protein